MVDLVRLVLVPTGWRGLGSALGPLWPSGVAVPTGKCLCFSVCLRQGMLSAKYSRRAVGRLPGPLLHFCELPGVLGTT
jgi:hypothetical protein